MHRVDIEEPARRPFVPKSGSRRALLHAAMGAIGVTGTAVILSTRSTAAASGDPLLIGRDNTGSATTDLTSRVAGPVVTIANTFNASSLVGPSGLQASIGRKTLAEFRRDNVAIYGLNTEPRDFASGYGVIGHGTAGAIGVEGMATNSIGVRAVDTAAGIGIKGYAFYGTAGQFETGPQGLALEAIGRVHFTQAGTVAVPGGSQSVDIVGPRVTPTSFMLATVQGTSAVFVRSAQRLASGTGGFRVRLSRNAPAGGLKLGYFVVD